jgi:hypothetical protein
MATMAPERIDAAARAPAGRRAPVRGGWRRSPDVCDVMARATQFLRLPS